MTVTANELRSGNWLQGEPMSHYRMGWWSDGKTQITAFGIHCIGEGRLKLKGIPLTAEILKSCGFELNTRVPKDGIGDEYEYWVMGWLSISEDISGNWYINDYHVNTKRFKFLHQLQNIFFALFGEELEYKPG